MAVSRIALVQPLLVTELRFTQLLASWVFNGRMLARDWLVIAIAEVASWHHSMHARGWFVRPLGISGALMEFTRVPIEAGAVACWHVSGPRPPVVCVHGAGISSRESLPFVARMLRETWAVDLPGFGRSGSLPAPASVRGYRDSLGQFLERTTGTKTHLVGWSLGAQIAVSFAAAVPDRVASLVLVGPTVDPRARSFVRQFGRWFRNSPHEPPSLTPQVLRDYRDAGWRHVTKAFRAALADSIETTLPRVQAPTLVLRGEHDRMVPQAWAEEATRLLPNGRLVVWPATGHMIPFATPGEFAETVEHFTAAMVAT